MAGFCIVLFLPTILVSFVSSQLLANNTLDEEPSITLKSLVFWPKGIVPFYVEKEHFDEEQSLDIMRAINSMMFKTCIKFRMVLARPQGSEHVLLFENPQGFKKCFFNNEPHSIDEPHRIQLGYDCMKSPQIDRVLMRALGFPFEHNRACRDIYIDVQLENIEPGYIELFTKDLMWPQELRNLPYDRNSVMHFGDREFSKNGHRTIIFKGGATQKRNGLSSQDVKKIRIVYEDQCILREKEEKIEECKNFVPGPDRRKRHAGKPYTAKSLRVNPNITPPDDLIETQVTTLNGNINSSNDFVPRATEDAKGYADAIVLVKELGIEKEVEDLIEQVHSVAAKALQKAREKYCNGTKISLRTVPEMEEPKDMNILGIIHDTAIYARNLVHKAVANLTEFCAALKSIDDYQRASCPFFNKNRCRQTYSYRSTKSGSVMYSTQHRPLIVQSTKHRGNPNRPIYKSIYRIGNHTESNATRDNMEDISIDKKNGDVDAKNRRFQHQIFRSNFRVTILNDEDYQITREPSQPQVETGMRVERPENGHMEVRKKSFNRNSRKK